MLISVSLFLLAMFIKSFKAVKAEGNKNQRKCSLKNWLIDFFVGYFMAEMATINNQKLKNAILSVEHPLSAELYRSLVPVCLYLLCWLLGISIAAFSCLTLGRAIWTNFSWKFSVFISPVHGFFCVCLGKVFSSHMVLGKLAKSFWRLFL